ncbi:hypothetical protein [Mollivirus kamchatka]|nr:hypothetical protein [Mollivirus kamchatka]
MTDNIHEVLSLLDDIVAFSEENLTGVRASTVPNPITDLDQLSATVGRINAAIREMPPTPSHAAPVNNGPRRLPRGRGGSKVTTVL